MFLPDLQINLQAKVRPSIRILVVSDEAFHFNSQFSLEHPPLAGSYSPNAERLHSPSMPVLNPKDMGRAVGRHCNDGALGGRQGSDALRAYNCPSFGCLILYYCHCNETSSNNPFFLFIRFVRGEQR